MLTARDVVPRRATMAALILWLGLTLSGGMQAAATTGAGGAGVAGEPPGSASLHFGGWLGIERAWRGWASEPAFELALCREACLSADGRIDQSLTGTAPGEGYDRRPEGEIGNFAVTVPAGDYKVAVAFHQSPDRPAGYLASGSDGVHRLVSWSGADVESVVEDYQEELYTVRVPKPAPPDYPSARFDRVDATLWMSSFVSMTFRVRNAAAGTRITVKGYGSCSDAAVSSRTLRRTGTYRASSANTPADELGRRFWFVIRATQSGKTPYTYRTGKFTPQASDRKHFHCS